MPLRWKSVLDGVDQRRHKFSHRLCLHVAVLEQPFKMDRVFWGLLAQPGKMSGLQRLRLCWGRGAEPTSRFRRRCLAAVERSAEGTPLALAWHSWGAAGGSGGRTVVGGQWWAAPHRR